MEKIPEKFLPVGTVVILKNGEKKLMITGWGAIALDNNRTMYDYSGCTYPEGVLSNKQVLLFNHSQIDKIFHMGLNDDEEKEYEEKFKKIIKDLKKKENESKKTED